MVREDTLAPSEGATCAWMAADEIVVCKRTFLMMWQSSRPDLCVNDIPRIHWSQHLLTLQSERPNSKATRLADHPASIRPMILPLLNCYTAAHIVFKNDVMSCLPQLLLCKRFSTFKQVLVTCFILHRERR
ncbi:uncharacterized protein TNCV_5026821 [Trichonephila clavipes]|uniref:Uncharacterized protein n=1 Tax=Trichonephila clavipes TaxID=2585209 RepID=A0A8X6VB31_TRICX|nr:uncharacterized protein TNCV_5026821 [Trichonephila clavipes]